MDDDEDEELFMFNLMLILRNRNLPEDENEGRPYPLVDVEWWRRLGDPTFKVHFRMSRITYESLVVVVGRQMRQTGRLEYPGMEVDRALMMTLWVLATPDSFRSVGVNFGLAKGSVHNQFKTIIAVLQELSGRYVCWPSDQELPGIARNFERRYGYPSVVGCVDGCHIYITAPVEQPQRYLNRHHSYSVILQGTCDDKMVFRDVHLGQPGSVGDNRTFRRSPLGKHLLRNQNFLREYHILADGAYTLTDKVIIPYKNYGNLTDKQRYHNSCLSRCRSMIERSFALLKGKWRRLKFFHTINLEYFMNAVMACIVLHNFILLEGDEYDNNAVQFDDADLDDGLYEQLIVGPRARGAVKREYIATMLYNQQEEE